MDTKRIPRTPRTTTTEHPPQEIRRSRGTAIATNRLKEIKQLSPGCYSVPASKPSEAYVVSVRPVEACSCEDSLRRNVRCKHRHAVLHMLRKSGVCEGCGVRHWNGDLREVVDSLTFFEGDMVCRECADATASETV
ncbi:MAG: hypothetical protein ACR2N0_15705 [Rubrobacteraceae bacterium]